MLKRRALLVGAAAGAVVVSCNCNHREALPESIDGVHHDRSLRLAFDRLRGFRVHAAEVPLVENRLAWAVRWQALSRAQRRIDVSYFIVENDAFGLALCGRLLERALQGVAVRLLVDARGSRPMVFEAGDYLQELVHAGIDVRVFNPVIPQLVRAILEQSPVPMASASHNKILLVDDDIAVTGGRNISRFYYSTPREQEHAIGDADVLLQGPEPVRALEVVMNAEFVARDRTDVRPDIVNVVSRWDELLLLAAAMDVWLEGGVGAEGDDVAGDLERAAVSRVGRPIDSSAARATRPRLAELVRSTSLWSVLPLLLPRAVRAEAQVVSGAARVQRRDDDDVNDALVRAIGGAQRRIMLESPYFIPTPRILKSLEEAAARGVSITLLTNSPLSSDNAMTQALFIDSWPEIIARVPTLKVYARATTELLHGKRAVFDDDLSFVGTYNIDPFSAHVNSELMIANWSQELAARTAADLEQSLIDGSMVEYTVRRDEAGGVLRDEAGDVVVSFGPADHTPPATMERLRNLKWLVLKGRDLWDFDVVVF